MSSLLESRQADPWVADLVEAGELVVQAQTGKLCNKPPQYRLITRRAVSNAVEFGKLMAGLLEGEAERAFLSIVADLEAGAREAGVLA